MSRRMQCAVVLLLAAGCSGSSYMQPAELIEALPEGRALVNIYRPSSLGMAIKFSIWERAELVGVSTAKSVIQLLVEPGEHLFIARAENMSALKIDAAAGKTYDLVAEVKMGAMKARVNLVPVTADSPHAEKMDRYRKACSPSELNPETGPELVEKQGIIIEHAVPRFDGGDLQERVRHMSSDQGH